MRDNRTEPKGIPVQSILYADTLLSRCRALLQCQRGSNAVEFALVALPLVTFTFIFIEICAMLFINVLVEGGLREAARYGITGYAPPGVSREQQILKIVKENTFHLIADADMKISYKVYPGFQWAGKGEPYTDNKPANGKYDVGEAYTDVNGNQKYDADLGEAGLGGAGDVVMYKIDYKWRLLTPLLSDLIASTGFLEFSASIAVRNEPFGTN